MRRAWRVGLVVATAVVIVAGALWALQRRLIYFPAGDVPPPPPGVEPVALTTSDGLDLAGWWVPARPADADRDADGDGDDAPASTVLVCNGNGGNRAGRLPLAQRLADRGHDVLLFDYRGYGGNPGQPSEDGLARDARAAHDLVAARADGPIVYLGESIGAGVCTGLAVGRPPDVLVLRSPFTSLPDVARHHYPVLPAGWLLKDRYPVLEQIGAIDAPTLVVAGTADDIVPVDLSRRVFEAAGEPREWVLVDGAGHNDAAITVGAPLVDAVDAFVRAHV